MNRSMFVLAEPTWRRFGPEGCISWTVPSSNGVFRDNAEHPPLGRWLLGIASFIAEPFEVLWKGPDPTGQYVLSGRLAPALIFAALVSLVTRARRLYALALRRERPPGLPFW